MLIYARCENAKPDRIGPGSSSITNISQDVVIPKPPPRALEMVEDMNNKYDEECDTYSQEYVMCACIMYRGILIEFSVLREDAAIAKFSNIRNVVRDIYQTWCISQASYGEVKCYLLS